MTVSTTESPGSLLVALGDAFRRRDRPDEALDAFDRALDEDPDVNAAALAGLVVVADEHDRGEAALRRCLVRIAHGRTVTAELVSTAHELLTRRRVQRERRWLEDEFLPHVAEDFEETDPELAFLVARVLLYLGRARAALPRLERVSTVRPNDARVLEALGEALRDTGRSDEAIVHLRSALVSAKDEGRTDRASTIATKLGRAIAAAGDHEDALEHLSEPAAEGDPYVYDRMLARAQSLLALGRLDEAFDAAVGAEQHRRRAVHPQLIKAHVHLARDELDEALDAAERALRADPSSAEALITRAQVLIEGQLQLEAGRKLLRRQAKRHDGDGLPSLIELAWQGRDADPGPWVARGELALAHADADGAQEALDAARARLGEQPPRARAAVHRLAAALAEAREDADAAAEALSEAGDAYMDARMPDLAVDMLRLARAQLEKDQLTLWRLAFALALQGYDRLTAAEQIACFTDAIEAGDAADRLGPPPADFAWSHLARAWSLAGLAVHDYEHASDYRWQAAAALERAVILQPWNGVHWGALALVHAGAGTVACACEASLQALDLQPDDPETLRQWAWALAAMDRPDAAAGIAEVRARIGESEGWLAGAQAQFVLLADGPEAALELLQEPPATASDGLDWGLDRSRLLRLLGREDEARSEWGRIRALVSDDRLLAEGPRRWHLAWLDYELGDIEAAEPVFLRAVDHLSISPIDPRINLAYCALLRKDPDAADRWFDDALRQSAPPGSYREAIIDMLALQARAADNPVALERSRRYLELLETARAERRDAVAREEAPDEELASVLAGTEVGSGRWLAATGAVARRRFMAERMDEAADAYRRILDARGEQFPEAQGRLVEALRGEAAYARQAEDFESLMATQQELVALGATSPLESDLDVADALIQTGRTDEASGLLASALERADAAAERVAVLERQAELLAVTGACGSAAAVAADALDLALRADLPTAVAELQALLAVTAPDDGDLAATLDAVRAAFRAAEAADLLDPATPLARIAEADPPLVTSRTRLDTLAETLAVLSAESDDAAFAHRLRELRLAFSRTVYRSLRHRPGTEPEIEIQRPAPLPIAMEGHPELFPEGADTPAVQRLIEIDIPALRDRVFADTGVPIPGVRIRPKDDIGPGRYAVLLHDRQRGTGWTRPGERFHVGATGFYRAADPLAGYLGAWLPAGSEDAMEGVDPLGFILRHVEATVRTSLHLFFGLPELRLLIEERLDPADQERASMLLADEVARPRMVGMGLLLIRERVPLTDVGLLVDVVGESDAETPLSVLLDRVRERIVAELPGLREGRPRLAVGSDVEDALEARLVRAAGREVVAMPPSEAEALRTTVLERVDPDDLPALVVGRPALRLPLWRLIVPAWPAVTVLSEAEVAAYDRSRDAVFTEA